MTLPPVLRKALLTLHVLTSVGWVGAVLVYLALGIAAATSSDAGLVRAVYLAMDLAAWAVLVPLALSSFVSGVLQCLLTSWGLFRHYWVIFKLVITAVATVVLISYTGTLRFFAEAASTPADLTALRNPSVVVHSGAALVLLILTTVLGVYKPAGLTRYGQRQRRVQRTAKPAHGSPAN